MVDIKNDLQHLLQQRSLPTLLILDFNGDLIFRNALTQDRNLDDEDYLYILEPIRGDIESIRKTWTLKHSVKRSRNSPFLQTVVTFREKTYGLRAFWLLNHSPERFPLVAVLLEGITTSRLDFHKAQNHFHLSAREMDVIEALERGMTDKKIASVLHVSPDTVRSYLKTIRARLGVSTRTEILHTLYST